ncbi:MAG: hypothetical protein HY263_02580 [Chloroflexi bacterium]|nr:hypothetical protein [Chloroflexota bacterium]
MSPLRRVRGVLAVIAVILGIAVLAPRETAAASACGARPKHTLVLSKGTVSPGSGSTGTRFAFTVSYADSDGCSPDRIVVVITGVGEYALNYIQGDLQTGATFGSTMKLPAGRWPYSFEASSGSGPGRQSVQLLAVNPATVQVVAPTPKPTAAPTATPTAAPTATPTAAPTAAPTGNATAAAPTGNATVPPGSGATPNVPTPAASASPTGSRAPDGTALAGAGLNGPTSPDATSSDARSPAMVFDPWLLPRPVLALAVSSVGTLLGLGLFAFLSRRLLRSSFRSGIGAGSSRSHEARVGLTGSRR